MAFPFLHDSERPALPRIPPHAHALPHGAVAATTAAAWYRLNGPHPPVLRDVLSFLLHKMFFFLMFDVVRIFPCIVFA